MPVQRTGCCRAAIIQRPQVCVSLSSTSLTFASQLVGTTSAAQTVTLNNTGNTALSVTSIVASGDYAQRSEEHTSELQSRLHLVCRLLLEKKNYQYGQPPRPVARQ